MNRIKQLREEYNISQVELGKKLNKTQQQISLYEKGINELDLDGYITLSNLFNCRIEYIAGKSDVRNFDKNIQGVEKTSSVPAVVFVYGTIPAGVPIEMIEDIIDTEEVSIEMTKGDKQLFGLRIKGDSMYPDYLDGDTIILEKVDDCESGEDCVVMVNRK